MYEVPFTLKFHGPVPVSVTERSVHAPLQIVVEPEIEEVGRGLTVIVAEPVMSPACAAQFASLRSVTE